jgi:hypothetical protein
MEPEAPESIDHDRLFKELLTTFFVEFVEAFLPDVYAYLEPESIAFLDKEVFTDITEGRKYESDIVVQAKFQGKDAFFLLIVENQSSAQSEFPERMFNYVARFWEKYHLPIYPVALFSYDQPLKAAPSTFSMEFPGFVVIQFAFRAIQLNQLSWKDYAKKRNPAATALMAKMQIPERTYLQMTRLELVAIQREVGLLPREEQNIMLTLTNEWIEEGIEKGIEQGLMQGADRMILRLFTHKFGAVVTEALRPAILALTLEQKEQLTEALLDFTSVADAQLWLDGVS